jgi:glycosyltransferase involved in cell wall biosynthesis
VARKKLKVALFHCGFAYSGGGERLIIEEAKGLIKLGHKVEIFVPTWEKTLCYPDQLKTLTVKSLIPSLPEWLPMKHALEMVLSSVCAPFYAFRFKKFDVFIGANQPGAWIAFCISTILKKSYIVYMNQPNRLLYPRKIDERVKFQNLKDYYYIDAIIKRFKFFVAWADRISFIGGKTMLANGSYIGEIIKKTYGKQYVACPAGAYPQRFSLLRVNPHTAYTGEFSITNKSGTTFHITKPYVLITNRHQPQKRFDYGIKALKEFIKTYPSMNLIIPGPFTDETFKLKRLVKDLNLIDHVLFTGQISENHLQKLYREAVLYIYTAPEEDFGMGIVEAMGWGVPVVAWRHAGPTVTIKDGETGYLAEPYAINDFAAKMIKAVKVMPERAEMGKKAWAHVRDNFSWDKHVGIMENALYEALGEKGNIVNKAIE